MATKTRTNQRFTIERIARVAGVRVVDARVAAIKLEIQPAATRAYDLYSQEQADRIAEHLSKPTNEVITR